jgi:Bacterial regulatory proteins, luxR family
MAYIVIEPAIREVGFCCTWAYFAARVAAGKTTKDIAKELQCSVRAVRYYKAKFKLQLLSCEFRPSCLKVHTTPSRPGTDSDIAAEVPLAVRRTS